MTIDEIKLLTLTNMYDLEVTKMMECVERMNNYKCQIAEVEKRMKGE